MRKIPFLCCLLLMHFSQHASAQSNAADVPLKATAEIQEHFAAPKKQMTEDDKIYYLLNFLRNLPGATFIRNGDEYKPGKAADHLESKWQKHKKKVKNAHEFVERIATYSKTKDKYQIRFSDGQTTTCGELLDKELNKLENNLSSVK